MSADDGYEALEAITRTTGTIRYFTEEDIPDEVLFKAFDTARFAPQGGNRQPVRWIVVRDQETKARLGELYLPRWSAYLDAFRKSAGLASLPSALQDADHFARNFASAPVIVVVCGHIPSLLATDAQLDRVGAVAGGSIYPTVQNFCLALRSLGVGTAITTFLVGAEPEVRKLLEIPEDFLTAAHIAVGRPARGFPRKLSREPVFRSVFSDRFDIPLFAGT